MYLFNFLSIKELLNVGLLVLAYATSAKLADCA